MNIFLKNIPNTLTCTNLMAGCVAIAIASREPSIEWGIPSLYWAYIFICIAAVADFLDGLAARVIGAYSDLGKELDSLCDLVSFGIAPTALLYNVINAAGYPWWVKIPLLMIPVCGAFRLARFNTDDSQHDSFLGLPIPANAIFWIGLTSLMYAGATPAPWVLVCLVVIESLYMMAPVRMLAFKVKHLGWRGNESRYIVLLGSIALIAWLGLPGLMWSVILYAAMSAINVSITKA